MNELRSAINGYGLQYSYGETRTLQGVYKEKLGESLKGSNCCCRKITALPYALFSIGSAVANLFNACRLEGDRRTVAIYSSGCDLQVAAGWVATLCSDDFGQRVIVKAIVHKLLYQEFLDKQSELAEFNRHVELVKNGKADQLTDDQRVAVFKGSKEGRKAMPIRYLSKIVEDRYVFIKTDLNDCFSYTTEDEKVVQSKRLMDEFGLENINKYLDYLNPAVFKLIPNEQLKYLDWNRLNVKWFDWEGDEDLKVQRERFAHIPNQEIRSRFYYLNQCYVGYTHNNIPFKYAPLLSMKQVDSFDPQFLQGKLVRAIFKGRVEAVGELKNKAIIRPVLDRLFYDVLLLSDSLLEKVGLAPLVHVKNKDREALANCSKEDIKKIIYFIPLNDLELLPKDKIPVLRLDDEVPQNMNPDDYELRDNLLNAQRDWLVGSVSTKNFGRNLRIEKLAHLRGETYTFTQGTYCVDLDDLQAQ